MTDAVEAAIGRLVPARAPASWVLREVQAAVGVVDLVAVTFDDDALAARIGGGLAPITLPLRIRTLDALGSRTLRVSTLARRIGRNPAALMRSTLAPLLDQGVVDVSGDRVMATGRWRPVTSRLTAVELKLASWRRALRQADNAALSADASWVVLDRTRARAATTAVDLFREYGVGLATIEPSGALAIACRPRGRRTVRWLHAWMGELAWAAIRGSVEVESAACSHERPPRVKESSRDSTLHNARKRITESNSCVEAFAHTSSPFGQRHTRELARKLNACPDLM